MTDKEKCIEWKSGLDLQHQASGRDVVPATCRLENLSAHQHGSHADLVVVLGPAADGPVLLQRDPLAALLPADGEGVVHEEPGLAGVDVVGAADVAVGGERGLGRGRHGVLPLGAVRDDHGLEGQGVHVEASQRLGLGVTSCRGLLVTLVDDAVDLPHLVEDGGHTGVGVGQHCDVGSLEKTQQVGELLFVHPQRVGLRPREQISTNFGDISGSVQMEALSCQLSHPLCEMKIVHFYTWISSMLDGGFHT